ncbi:hypothetical protein AR457_13650 [Streptomyces agglomeratus]|uniref:Uncharacterized protein n=1 Tax=Streptomyces agglomeratus TaxID=285458 RepID=A0A1E5P751_9ACTN|nr:hypothetical protein AS594_13480 [Streptomyces agglomeratus]OEJ40615.1 hypothetical protein BGK70_23000 [Streptomyces agglomeratus]OEJ45004.1 hypothetical protein AR457_13650 [Streptomyces agglomeratus]OEJ53162.1 hypothetical protein BGK72_22620 [Streptomyces agglomeratus]OEJ60499.1 hypothetical protein BGM19_23330 [Streptomyces agglomeratus]
MTEDPSTAIAAYCERIGTAEETLRSYLQTRQQHSRASGPSESDRQELAGILGDPLPTPTTLRRSCASRGVRYMPTRP